MSDNFNDKIQDAIANPMNMGEMEDADSVGTVGSPECGDMVRLWLKFSEKDGKKIVDKASFQSFGCQTAIAVASLATEMLQGKTVEEARQLDSTDLAAPLGPLPPMKIHCGQMVEGALKRALDEEGQEKSEAPSLPESGSSSTLLQNIHQPGGTETALRKGKIKIVKLD